MVSAIQRRDWLSAPHVLLLKNRNIWVEGEIVFDFVPLSGSLLLHEFLVHLSPFSLLLSISVQPRVNCSEAKFDYWLTWYALESSFFPFPPDYESLSFWSGRRRCTSVLCYTHPYRDLNWDLGSRSLEAAFCSGLWWWESFYSEPPSSWWFHSFLFSASKYVRLHYAGVVSPGALRESSSLSSFEWRCILFPVESGSPFQTSHSREMRGLPRDFFLHSCLHYHWAESTWEIGSLLP